MANLMRSEASDMVTLRDMMNQLFEDAWVSPWSGARGSLQTFRVPLDVTEDENNFYVKAALPGINPDDVQVTVHDNMLSIKGEVKPEERDENTNFHIRERRYGSFERTVTLPVSIDSNDVDAEYENGILTLTLPKAEEAKPKRINIKAHGQQKTLQGQTTQTQKQ